MYYILYMYIHIYIYSEISEIRERVRKCPPAAAPPALHVLTVAGLLFTLAQLMKDAKKQADGDKSTTIFPTADKKRKAPASLQGLERSALYTIATRGCIVVKWS